MNEAEEQLLKRMKELAPKRGYGWVKCLSEEDIVQAEAKLAFPLPPLLRRIYLEVGEGVFSLSSLYLKSLNGQSDIPLIDSYIGLRSEGEKNENGGSIWPEKLLIIYDWGCNIYSCLDCSHPEQRVLRNDNNRDLDVYALEAPSLQQWLQALLDGTLHFDWNTAEKVTI